MNNEQAKHILALFRPGSADEQDSDFAEALRLAKTDAELARWFDDHRASYLALQRRFKEIPVPAGLKEQILSERKVNRTLFQQYRGQLLAAAAVILLLLGLEAGSWLSPGIPRNHTPYLLHMADVAVGIYSMDLETSDPAQIRAFVAKKHGSTDYVLPAGLKQADTTGCQVFLWQGSRVSMICFKTGRPLQPERKGDLWLFISDRTTVADAPPPNSPPVFARVESTTMARWSDDHNTYALAAVADKALLDKFLQ